jgi:hypothetical protein
MWGKGNLERVSIQIIMVMSFSSRRIRLGYGGERLLGSFESYIDNALQIFERSF